ncbi:hypothetical protein Dsin_018637 [Dipteronia sinensis]|uniref:DUF4283 domain-containing protein n=1 Tax=Dipteronia sinensis TaxID=43782 RepID=A0AAE0A5U9_9ROSI|nr:hypothetical protein Dsin_018637 [Dipteronia sinensis]
MMDSSSSMDPSPKHLSLPCLGSHPPFLETISSSISSVLPPIPSMKDCPLPSPHKVSSANVISFLKAKDSIKCNNVASKGEHCPSIKIILNTAINARNGKSALNGAIVAKAKGHCCTSQERFGKDEGTENQCNRSEKSVIGAHRPDQLQLVLSTSFGNVEKPASKGAACPSANVEGQIVQLEEVSSLRNSKLPHTKGIFVTLSLVNKNANNVIGHMPPLISENSVVSYSNVLKGAHHGPFMDIPTSRPMNLKYYQPFQSGNRKCVSPLMEVAEDGSKAWKNYLVGYFIEKKLTFSLVNNIAMLLWGNRGLQEVLANDKGFFFFKFSDDKACSNVLESGP